MIDVSKKFSTVRTAVAAARIRVSPETIARLETNDLPKKDPLILARWAGIQAAKKTSELIPACHPVPIDFAGIEFEIQHEKAVIIVTSTIKAEYKTGVEMEALTAASVAALTVYDMLKPVDDNLEITDVKLVSKTGGLHAGNETKADGQYTAAVVVVSDSAATGEREDFSGSVAIEILSEMGFAVDKDKRIVPDDPEEITSAVVDLCNGPVNLVITTGGTGLGPRDTTDKAIKDIIEREALGIAEWVRAYGRSRTPRAILSNGIAGIRNGTLIICLPGSPKAVTESLDALKPTLMHALEMMKGGGH
jgi:molybdenum cofactor biosynthesis protein MoaC